MKVLHVSSAKSWRGGEQQVLLLMGGLARRGVVQDLLAPVGSPLASRAQGAGLPATETPLRNEGDPRALRRVAARLRRGRFDVLHLHTSQAHGLGAVAARLVGRRRPAVVVTRRVQHSIFRHSFLRLDRLKYSPGADRVLCVSALVRDVLEADGVPPSRLAVVPDGVDLERFRPEARVPRDAVCAALGVPTGAPLVGTVGHLDAGKGHDVLVAAFARLRDELGAFCVFVGEGRERAVLERSAAEHGVAERVVFAGFRDDVPDVLHALHAFAFPSRHEGLGSALLEAMAARVPVVATRVGGVPEVVRDGVDGLLVPPDDPAALGDAIRAVLRDPQGAADRAAAARARVEASFSARHMVDATLGEYRSVLDLRRRS